MIVALAGGVGGAKMAHGLALAAGSRSLHVIVNTADDFEHLGLQICPDLDTVMYTLGGIANPETGWGIAGDTRDVLDAIVALGGPGWFLLGDRDFATHILRSDALKNGRTLSEITAELSAALGISTSILPMSDDPVRTIIETANGPLAFQEYFVGRQQKDEVTGVWFDGASTASAPPDALHAIAQAEVLVIAPSNPIVSIGPILGVEGYRQALRDTGATRIAISPIIGGKALKGPADRMLASLGHESTAIGVARLYAGLLDGFVIDNEDAELGPAIEALGMELLVTDSIMRTTADRARFGKEVLEFASTLKKQTGRSR